MPDCGRCGAESEQLYDYSFKNEDEELIQKKICWDCDHDVMNGRDYFDNVGEVLMDRAENNYAFDPIYYPKPSWMP